MTGGTADGGTHARALLQAMLVTLLWSSSVVLIKIGLADIPPLLFAGLRYGVAALCLVPLACTPAARSALRALGRRDLALLVLLGLVQYAVTQGAQFVSLHYLPAATVSLMLAFTPMLVALASGLLLGERVSVAHWTGLGIALAGATVYFAGADPGRAGTIGLAVCALGLVANAGQTLLGRYVNRTAHLPPLLVTTPSMAIGALVLLPAGALTAPLPVPSLQNWLIVLWLAAVNTAFAFTLWNHTQRTLPAVETSLINTSMLFQVTLMTWAVLGEAPAARQWLGIALVLAGVVAGQLPKLRASPPARQRA